MNYILQLKQDLADRDAIIRDIKEQIDGFMVHLDSDKFKSTETERNDWIATGDVVARLQAMRISLGGV